MARVLELSCIQGVVSLFPVPNVLLTDVKAVWMDIPWGLSWMVLVIKRAVCCHGCWSREPYEVLSLRWVTYFCPSCMIQA